MCNGCEEGSYLKLIDWCITQLGLESNKEEEGAHHVQALLDPRLRVHHRPVVLGSGLRASSLGLRTQGFGLRVEDRGLRIEV